MILIFTHLFLSFLMSQEIFDFNKSSDLSGWMIVDDVVMGGRSSGVFRLDKEGHGVFEGEVSLENNGGFSSVRYEFENMQVNENVKINLRLRGDGKVYQFRIKSTASDYVSFVTSFTTTGKWEEIEIELKDMYPSFRGRILDQPNFSSDSFESITFLIGNKKQENFQLLIDNISLK